MAWDVEACSRHTLTAHCTPFMVPLSLYDNLRSLFPHHFSPAKWLFPRCHFRPLPLHTRSLSELISTVQDRAPSSAGHAEKSRPNIANQADSCTNFNERLFLILPGELAENTFSFTTMI